MKNVAIIGAGLQAKRRTSVILNDSNYKVSWVVDLIEERAKKLANHCRANYATDWRPIVQRNDIDIVLTLTYPDSHAAISIEAMKNGKDVLCEKPLARTEKDAQEMIKIAKKTRRILKCGFNHRHHPAILEAHYLFKKNLIGKPIFARGCYGIAGRQGLEKEWRSDPKIVSGGQLMEQGIHLVDLFRWFLGDFSRVAGFIEANFWQIAPLEDNAFAIFQTKKGTVASIHSSLTQWINLFELEIYGEKGSLTVSGLGESYGVEKLIINIHDPDGPFSYKTIEFRGRDRSWDNEWEEFTKAIETRKEPIGGASDGLKAIEIVNAVYQASKTGKTVSIK